MSWKEFEDRLKCVAYLSDGKPYGIMDRHPRFDIASNRFYKKIFYVKTVVDTPDEDWKTASVHKIPRIPKGTRLAVKDLFLNYYGQYIIAEYNGWSYYINPKNVAYDGAEEIGEDYSGYMKGW